MVGVRAEAAELVVLAVGVVLGALVVRPRHHCSREKRGDVKTLGAKVENNQVTSSCKLGQFSGTFTYYTTQLAGNTRNRA